MRSTFARPNQKRRAAAFYAPLERSRSIGPALTDKAIDAAVQSHLDVTADRPVERDDLPQNR
jgi:hypothetical protein